MIDYYDWIKALHLISVIAWLAGLLYLPRLFVYHAEAAPGSAGAETFKVMERRLLRGIMNPAMIATWIFGITMLWIGFDIGMFGPGSGWLHVKLLFVVILTGLHMAMSRWRRDFEADRNTRSARFYRFLNEVPALIMVVVVVMVIVKPF